MFSSKLRTGPRVVPHDFTYALLVILHHHSPAGQLAAATSSPTALPHGRRAPPCRRRRLLLHVLPSSSSPPLSATLSSSPYQPYRYSPAPRIYLSLSGLCGNWQVWPLHVGSIRREAAVPGGPRGRDRRQRRCVLVCCGAAPPFDRLVELCVCGVLSWSPSLMHTWLVAQRRRRGRPPTRRRRRPGQASTNCSASRAPSRRAWVLLPSTCSRALDTAMVCLFVNWGFSTNWSSCITAYSNFPHTGLKSEKNELKDAMW
jgi:hypothetical protein